MEILLDKVSYVGPTPESAKRALPPLRVILSTGVYVTPGSYPDTLLQALSHRGATARVPGIGGELAMELVHRLLERVGLRMRLSAKTMREAGTGGMFAIVTRESLRVSKVHEHSDGRVQADRRLRPSKYGFERLSAVGARIVLPADVNASTLHGSWYSWCLARGMDRAGIKARRMGDGSLLVERTQDSIDNVRAKRNWKRAQLEREARKRGELPRERPFGGVKDWMQIAAFMARETDLIAKRKWRANGSPPQDRPKMCTIFEWETEARRYELMIRQDKAREAYEDYRSNNPSARTVLPARPPASAPLEPDTDPIEDLARLVEMGLRG